MCIIRDSILFIVALFFLSDVNAQDIQKVYSGRYNQQDISIILKDNGTFKVSGHLDYDGIWFPISRKHLIMRFNNYCGYGFSDEARMMNQLEHLTRLPIATEERVVRIDNNSIWWEHDQFQASAEYGNNDDWFHSQRLLYACSKKNKKESIKSITKMDFFKHGDFVVEDNFLSSFFIHYQGNRYEAYMPLESESLTNLVKESLLEESSSIKLNTPLADTIKNICLSYRGIWETNIEKIKPRKLQVHGGMARIIFEWKGKKHELTVNRNDSLTSSNPPDTGLFVHNTPDGWESIYLKRDGTFDYVNIGTDTFISSGSWTDQGEGIVVINSSQEYDFNNIPIIVEKVKRLSRGYSILYLKGELFKNPSIGWTATLDGRTFPIKDSLDVGFP